MPFLRSSHRHAPYSYYQSYIEDVLGAAIGDYTLFTSIRNPWARIVSGFHYTQQRGRASRRHPLSITRLRRYHIPGLAERLFGPKIGVLAHMVCMANDSLRDPIAFWLENHDVDYVLRCESLSDDFTAMCGALDLTLPLLTYNTSKTVDYRQYYNWFSRRLVGWAHRKSIRRFGYSFDA